MNDAPQPLMPFESGLLERDVETAARALIGAVLRHGPVAVVITEVEAYGGPEDSASHARHGRTARTEVFWGPPGRAYVYLCYGIHEMLNIVAGPQGIPSAILIRAAKPLFGKDLIADRRGGRTTPDSLAGPGKLSLGLEVDRRFNDHPLLAPEGLELLGGLESPPLLAGPRVGIDFADQADRQALRRFALADCPWVSHRKSLRPWAG